MVLVSSNKAKNYVQISYIEKVNPAELQGGLEDIKLLLKNLPTELHLLVDFTQLELMEPACSTQIGLAMDIFNRHGFKLIVRIIPDPTKDIGMNILSIFHYAQGTRIVTCGTLLEAAKVLGL